MEASGAKRMYFEFHNYTFIGELSTANVSFGCKGLMYLVDFPQVLAALPNIKYSNCTLTAIL